MFKRQSISIFTILLLLISPVISLAASEGGSPGPATLIPTDDVNDRYDLGDRLAVSRWTHAFFRFDTSDVIGNITNATFRVYYEAERAPLNLAIGGVENDDWTEGVNTPATNYQLHSDPGQQLDSIVAIGSGYIEFNVTDFVSEQMNGDGIVSLEVASDIGRWDYFASRESDTPPVLLIDLSGQPLAVASASETTGNAPLQITFSGSESLDNNGTIVGYSWDLGDGNTADGLSVEHTYTEIGQYQVTLTVTDNDFEIDTDTITVNITDPNQQVSTINPTDDVNDRYDLGDRLAVSRWTHAFFRFDTSDVIGNITNATFRVYYEAERAPLNLAIGGVENDDWTEGVNTPATNYQLHSDPGQQLDSIVAIGSGYIEFNVTDFVSEQMNGDGIVSLEVASDIGRWDYFASRESDTPPELVIESQQDVIAVSSISGVVVNAIDSAPLAGVRITLSGTTTAETVSDAAGNYSFTDIPVASGYIVSFTLDGYIDQVYNGIGTIAESTTFLETVLQIDEAFSGPGNVNGIITDALTGIGLSGVTLNLRAGINTRNGDIITSSSTADSGRYEFIELEAGNYTAEASLEGYQTGYFSIVSVGGIVRGNQNTTLTPLVTVDNIRVVLTWGETPRDLDSHFTGPIPGTSERFHVYFSGSSPFANLDIDDVSSFGPETITLTEQSEGVYRYSIHDYSNRRSDVSNELALSGARVQVFGENGLLQEFNVPNQPGTLWTVFELNGNTVNPVNTMTFESNPSSVRSLVASGQTDAALVRNLPEKEAVNSVLNSGGGGSMGWLGLIALGLAATRRKIVI